MLKIARFHHALVFVAFSSLSALSIASILAIHTYNYFAPLSRAASLTQILFITAVISIPLSVLFAMSSLKMSRYQKELENRANTDELTGLHNRRRFLELIDKAIDDGSDFIIAFVDLDRFKAINDRYGHGVGDEVFCEIAKRMRELPTPVRIEAARLGGDEFGMLIRHGEAKQNGLVTVNALYEQICEPIHCQPGIVSVGASIGLAKFPDDAGTSNGLLTCADSAMLRAKAVGGGIEQFDADKDRDHDEDAAIEVSLRTAIRRKDIIPVYQPVIDLASGTVIGHEVLARWPDSGARKAYSPGRFIPVAERIGAIDDLFWSLCDQVLSGPAARNGGGMMAMNVSPNQLQDADFPHRLANVLARHGVSPIRLELEVTETAMFRDMRTAINTLNELARMGVTISLDDFGTGHSSLSLVRQLPLSKLKIDRSFVGSIEWSAHSVSIVEATISLCEALQLKVCAEGVETDRQMGILRDLNCDLAQGFFIGAPAAQPRQIPVDLQLVETVAEEPAEILSTA